MASYTVVYRIYVQYTLKVLYCIRWVSFTPTGYNRIMEHPCFLPYPKVLRYILYSPVHHEWLLSVDPAPCWRARPACVCDAARIMRCGAELCGACQSVPVTVHFPNALLRWNAAATVECWAINTVALTGSSTGRYYCKEILPCWYVHWRPYVVYAWCTSGTSQ